jgi:two-component system response regulator WspF
VSGNYGLVYEALGAGAVDAVNTPTLGLDGSAQGGEALLAKIAQVARKVKVATRPDPPPAAGPPLVAIGASTGGPQAVAEVLAEFPATLPAAVLIVQHITPDFTAGLAEWVGQKSRFPVRLAEPGDVPRSGAALLAGRDDHLVLRPDRTLGYTPHPADTPFRPSVDVLFDSLAAHWPSPGVAVLLTGMGRDGANGLLALRRAGWTTYAQSGPTCVVNGMPDAAVKLGAAVHVLPPVEIGKAIVGQLRRTG